MTGIFELEKPAALHFAVEAVARASLGDSDGARAALARYRSSVTATNLQQHSIAAYIALCAGDLRLRNRP